MQSIVQETTEVTGMEVCSLYLWDADGQHLTLTATHGLPAKAIGELTLGLGQGITGWVAEQRKPVALVDAKHDARFVWIPGVDDDRYISMLSTPVVRGDQLYGVLNVQTQGEHHFSAAETDFLTIIASHLATVLEVTGLHRQLVLTDALRVSEERLRQAQKMEAIGLLAGGVAHDFNNLLTAIIGFAHLIDRGLPAESPMAPLVAEIIQAGERASALTGQLLAFSRRQVLRPEVLDLATVVADMGRMVDRLIGEDVEIVTISDEDLGKIFVDRGQIEQVILNLAVNARDAMPHGGTITIETANVNLDETYLIEHGPREVGIDRPGRYVLLAVSDTGTGMDRETQVRIFEPFFTTKDQGKGTGLGLATVYGIVKQSGGDIWVYSELGRGTTVKIYLPLHTSEGEAADTIAATIPPHGSETILLVEDEPGVRAMARMVLEECGYAVVDAGTAEEALLVARAYAGIIELLVTDLVLPGQSGRQLFEQLVLERPQTRVLYMSGYTDDVVVRHGVMTAELSFLPKPFTPLLLAQTVREVLDKPPPLSVN